MNTLRTNSKNGLNRCKKFVSTIFVLTIILPIISFSQYSNPALVNMGTAGNYKALSGTSLTINAGCTVNGNVGGVGVTNNGIVNGTTDISNGAVTTALNDLTIVKNDLAGRSPDATPAVELGGTLLQRGIYSSGTFEINGTLTLNGSADDIFIFKAATTLIAGSSCIVTMTGGALSSNVFWQVGSAATITGNFKGNILASTDITQTGGVIDGRTLALTAVTLGGTSVLPVELTSFTAIANNNKVELNWKTATEINNYGFDIGRKTKNTNWQKIGFIQGNRNSNSPKEYSFTDLSPIAGKLQYQLKQIDLNGVYEFSKIVEVEIEIPKRFSLSQNYPNPFNPSTSILFEISVKSNVVITVYNVIGVAVVALMNEEKLPGKYQIEFKGSNLATGIYFYSIRVGDNKPIVKKMTLLK